VLEETAVSRGRPEATGQSTPPFTSGDQSQYAWEEYSASAFPQEMWVSICESTTSEHAPETLSGGESNRSDWVGWVAPAL
jgi:hypothetical protein